MSKRKSNPGLGRKFHFFGKFRSLILARRRERERPRSFILERDGYYYVLKSKKKSNPAEHIYQGWIKGIDLNGITREMFSPRYNEKYKAQRWLRDAITIAKRTDFKITNSAIIGGSKKKNLRHKTMPIFSSISSMRSGIRKRHRIQKNPRMTLIYGKVLKIFAQKTDGPYKGQRFVHTFKHGARMYGMPDGSLRIVHP